MADPTAGASAGAQPPDHEVRSATLRALADEPDLRLRGGRPFRGEQPMPARAPHLREGSGLAALRGGVDGYAQHARLTDPSMHAAHLPTHPVAALVFECLEQFRVESFTPLPGSRRNLRESHRSWVSSWLSTGATDSEAGRLILAALLMAHARTGGHEIDERVADLIESARFSLAPRLGANLRALGRCREDQQAYAAHAVAIAEAVAGLVDEAAPDFLEEDASGQATGFALLLEDLDQHEAPLVSSGHSTVLADAEDGYAVFTRAYDEESPIVDLVRGPVLDQLQAELDERVQEAGIPVTRVARDLRAVLESAEPSAWQTGLEDGQLDGRALTRVVTSPRDPRVYRDRTPDPTSNTTVTLLLDCSGSMRTHAPSLAVAASTLTRALELIDVPSEVLGFTTRSWNGGRTAKDWQRARRPGHPGRLNERQHLVLAAPDAPRREVRRGLAGLLRGDLFREGLDGEAVTWACRRLRARGGVRRLLVVVSDGSPMDTATHRTNDEHYLEHHLRQVVAEETRGGGVEILGLGIGGEAGVDLSPYYDRCASVTSDEPLGMVRAIVSLMSHR